MSVPMNLDRTHKRYSYCRVISFDDETLAVCLRYALGQISRHKDQRQLNKLAMNAFNLLKGQSKRVVDFFLGNKKEDEEDKEKRKDEKEFNITDREKFISEQELLIREDNFVYLNCEGEFPYLDKLFGFVLEQKEEETMNITAAHYFTDIVISLLAEQPEKILRYLFTNKTVLDAIVKNVKFRSFKNLLGKIINVEKNEDKPNADLLFFRFRYINYERLIDSMVEVGEESVNGISEIFIDLIKEEENIAESNYFIDKLLIDPEKFRSLLSLLKAKTSLKLFELVGLIIERVFVKKEPEQPQLRRTNKKGFNAKPNKKNNLNINSKNFESQFTDKKGDEEDFEEDDSPEFLPIDQEEEQQQDNNQIPENEVNDSNDMHKMDLIQIIEQELPSIVMTLTTEKRKQRMHQDGLSFNIGNSKSKISVLKLMTKITKIEFDILRDILVDRTAVRLVLVG